MNDDLNKQRKEASLQSKGDSLPIIKEKIHSVIKTMDLRPESFVIDIGCGKGELLTELHKLGPSFKLAGCDITEFETDFPFQFLNHDLNLDFDSKFATYDLVVASEVIEHLENPRHFLREVTKILAPHGKAIISTPNVENIKNLMALLIKGFYSDFGPRAYPAHISPITSYAMKNMVGEIYGMTLKEVHYTGEGRIPGLPFKWQNVAPFLRGKHFSDNVIFVIEKDA